MECFVDAHYFPLPTQGNIYSVVNLQQSNGKNKTLVATLKRKIYSCEFIDENNILLPVIKEVPFTYIPTGAEIISIDAFNRSKTCDDFFIGITIIKVNGDQSTETYLNIYTEQDVEEKGELNLDCLAQNCLMLELTFVPYQLYHTSLFNQEKIEEAVWLLSGSDLKMHLFREDPQNHTYCEIEAEDIFPEFSRLPSIVFWVDIKHTSDKERRLTAFGCECGLVKIFMVDITKNVLLLNISNQFDAPVSRVSLFTVKTEPVYTKSSVLGRLKEKNDALNDGKSHRYNLLVINTLQPSVVFMDVVDGEFENRIILPDSDKYDIALCACIADVNMDTTKEILIGTFAKELLVYKYENAVWILQGQHKFSHSVHSINYVDITGDGVKELIVVTMLGVQIFQVVQTKLT
nr:KICSTOR complex protein kaptin-like isoform X2 [Halyomorpha halys]